MNFIKLLPILLFGLPNSGECRPIDEQQLLPAIPGYVPVYIQTGNIPPDIEALYHARRVAPELDQETAATEHEDEQVQKHVKNPSETKVVEVEKNEETTEKVVEQKPDDNVKQTGSGNTKEQEEKKKDEGTKTSTVEELVKPSKVEESSEGIKIPSTSTVAERNDATTIRSLEQVREISQYQVKESQVD